MAREVTSMSLQLYGIAINKVNCNIKAIGTTVATVKNATLLFWGGSANKADDSIIIYQIK